MNYIDEDDIQEKVRLEISNMIIELRNTTEKAKVGNWDLEAEIEEAIMIIEKAMAVINYYKGKIY